MRKDVNQAIAGGPDARCLRGVDIGVLGFVEGGELRRSLRCRLVAGGVVALQQLKPLFVGTELGHQIDDRINGGFRFPLLVTHEEMASMSCTTRETAARTLGQFRKDGWISIEGAIMTIHQPADLQALF